MHFIIFLFLVGGAISFFIYYLLYTSTLEKKDSVERTSFAVRTPLIFTLVNVAIFVPIQIPISTTNVILGKIFDIFFMYILYLSAPLAIATISISIMHFKKKLTSAMRLGIIILVNSICVFIVFMIYSVILSEGY